MALNGHFHWQTVSHSQLGKRKTPVGGPPAPAPSKRPIQKWSAAICDLTETFFKTRHRAGAQAERRRDKTATLGKPRGKP